MALHPHRDLKGIGLEPVERILSAKAPIGGTLGGGFAYPLVDRAALMNGLPRQRRKLFKRSAITAGRSTPVDKIYK
jgi:hypothetical protein